MMHLFQVKDKQTDNTILEPQPGPIQGTVSFLPGKALDLKGCGLKTKTERSSSDTEIAAPDGTRIMIRWNLEPGLGDLILRMSAKTPKPVSWIRYSLNGFDISAHPLTSVDGHGTGQVGADKYVNDKNCGDTCQNQSGDPATCLQ